MSNKIKNGDMPAMPIGEQIDSMHMKPQCNGLTKREYFALKIACALIVAEPHWEQQGYHMSDVDKEAVKRAEELLEALEK